MLPATLGTLTDGPAGLQYVSMTTHSDGGDAAIPQMIQCNLNSSNVYTSLELALRDMRKAGGRDLATGAGVGNESWIGLSLAMVVLDTLSGSSNDVGARWERLLTSHGISAEDARIIYKLRCSLLHGYGLPKPSTINGRTLLVTPDPGAFALDTSEPGQARVSVPAFCGRLTERIAAEAPGDWDTSLINTNVSYP
jgi:hypothetical protein